MNRVLFALLVLAFGLEARAPLETSQPIECTLLKIERTPIRPGISPLKLLNTALSTNWSGYVGASNLSHPATDSVTAVSGSWAIPMLHSTTTTTYSATWVGIDGFSSSTVEQIGTAQNWVGKAQQNYAWFEMYPMGAYEIVGFPTNVGDVITASVEYTGSNIFELQIENVTRKVYYTVPSSYTHSSSALRNSAEWIMEAPSSGSGVLPLADFGNATFTNCEATISGISAPLVNTHWPDEAIEMETSGRVIKAIPSAVYGQNLDFMVTWEHQ
jgi:hypothetical protein